MCGNYVSVNSDVFVQGLRINKCGIKFINCGEDGSERNTEILHFFFLLDWEEPQIVVM